MVCVCACVMHYLSSLCGLSISTDVCLCRTYYCSAGLTSQMIVMISKIFCGRLSDCRRRSYRVVHHIQSSCHAVPTRCCTHSDVGNGVGSVASSVVDTEVSSLPSMRWTCAGRHTDCLYSNVTAVIIAITVAWFLYLYGLHVSALNWNPTRPPQLWIGCTRD